MKYMTRILLFKLAHELREQRIMKATYLEHAKSISNMFMQMNAHLPKEKQVRFKLPSRMQ